MNRLVSPQCRTLPKTFSANITFKRFHSRVPSIMHIKSLFSGERFFAVATFIRSIRIVGFHVDGQTRGLFESFPANRADEIPVLRMSPSMLLQMNPVGKFFPADLANVPVIFRVDPQMRFQRTLKDEFFFAMFADEQFSPVMQPDVMFKG